MVIGCAVLLGIIAILAVLWVKTPLLTVWYTRLFWGGPEKNPVRNEFVTEDGIRVTENECYSRKFDNSYMDIYLPESGSSRAVIWLHGGGFVADDKSLVSETAMKFAREGYAFFNLNYALAPETPYPGQLEQIGAAYRYIVDHENRYQIEDANFVFGGDSAGGQLAGQFVNIQVDPGYAQTVGLESTGLGNRICGVIFYSALLSFLEEQGDGMLGTFLSPQFSWAFFGQADWRSSEQAAQAGILGNVSPLYPPVFITDGTVDSFTLQAEMLVDELEAKYIPYQTNLYDPDFHTLPHEYQFDYSYPEAVENIKKAFAFLSELSW